MNPAEFANIARSEREFWWYRGMREITFRLLDPVARPGDRVLEAGCGTGYFSKVLSERYRWNMFPLDLSAQALDYARGYGLQRLVRADIATLPFAAASFDAAVSMDVLVHFPRGDETRALSEFARVLKPGGLLALRVSALNALRSRHSEFAQERQRFTRARLRAACEAAGFRVERITYVNSLLLPVALFKFRIWEPLTRAQPATGVQPVAPWLDSLLRVPLRVEASCIGQGLNFPLGQSLVVFARGAGPRPAAASQAAPR
jgi:SAM-dependent methyltransferase